MSMPMSAIASSQLGSALVIKPYVCDSCRASLLRRQCTSHLRSTKPLVEFGQFNRLKRNLATKSYTTVNSLKADHQQRESSVVRNKVLKRHASIPAKAGATHGGQHNLEKKQTVNDDVRVRQATQVLRDTSAKERLGDENYKQLVSILHDRRNGYASQQVQTKPVVQKLRQSAAATAALAQFRTPMTDVRLSNRNLLSELSICDRDNQPLHEMEPMDNTVLEQLNHQLSLDEDQIGSTSCSGPDKLHTKPQYERQPQKTKSDHTQRAIYGIKDVPLPSILRSRSMQRGRGVSKEEGPLVREMSNFEYAVYQNPYAHALASPLRHCFVTGLRQPASLLAGFGLHLDESSGLPWMVPDDARLEKAERAFIEPGEQSPFSLRKSTCVEANTPDIDQGDYSSICGQERTPMISRTIAVSFPKPSSVFNEKTNSLAELTEMHSAEMQPDPPRNMISKSRAMKISGLKAYAVRSRSGLKWIVDNALQMSRSIPVGWRIELKSATKDLVIRQNMDNYVTRLLRHKAARHLAWLSTLEKNPPLERLTHTMTQGSIHHQIDANSVSKSASVTDETSHVMAILNLGAPFADDQAALYCCLIREFVKERTQEDVQFIPPVYNLPQLLGPEALSWLQAERQGGSCGPNLFAGNVVAVKRDVRTVKMLTLLWNLRQCFEPDHTVTGQNDS